MNFQFDTLPCIGNFLSEQDRYQLSQVALVFKNVMMYGITHMRCVPDIPELQPYVINISMSDDFNHPIILPPTLEVLHMGMSFNQPIELPLTLKVIHIGRNFNQMIEFPDTVEVHAFDWDAEEEREADRVEAGILREDEERLSEEFESLWGY